MVTKEYICFSCENNRMHSYLDTYANFHSCFILVEKVSILLSDSITCEFTFTYVFCGLAQSVAGQFLRGGHTRLPPPPTIYVYQSKKSSIKIGAAEQH